MVRQVDVPQTAPVQIRIYDLQGRVVENLASRVFAARTHSIAYDASGHASGTYIVRMMSGDFSTAQKIMLLK
jgi:hypothetical protein